MFDEIEKASKEVVRTLLNVLDTGRLMFPSGNVEVIRNTALRQHFDPEFLNRIDQILTFNRLTDNWLETLLDIELAGLNRRLSKKQANLSLSLKLRDELCRGYDVRYGARETLRAFRQRLETAIARALLAYSHCYRFEASMKCREVSAHQYVE
ncbi:MAG: hypothetical protein V7760_02925 [Marinobacter sp.]